MDLFNDLTFFSVLFLRRSEVTLIIPNVCMSVWEGTNDIGQQKYKITLRQPENNDDLTPHVDVDFCDPNDNNNTKMVGRKCYSFPRGSLLPL